MQFPTERQSFHQNFPFPAANETVYETPPTFIWLPVDGASSYTLTVKNAAKQTVCTVQTAVHYATPPEPLPAGDYYWHVESDNGAERADLPFTVAANAVFFDRPTAAQVFDGMANERPRLLFYKSDVPGLCASHQKELQVLQNNVREAYAHGMPTPPTFHYADSYRNEYRVYFGEYRDYCDRDMVACALQYALTGDEQAGAHAKALLKTVCDWNPAGPCSQLDGYGDEVGLSNARCLPAVYDLLFDRLTDKERSYIGKTIAQYATQCEERLNLVNYVANPSNSHVGRIPAYMGSAALALKGTGVVADEVLERWLSYALDIYCGIFPFYGGADGSWAEGAFYASSYTKWYLPFFAAVERFSGKSLMNRPFYHRYTNFLIHFCNMTYENHPFGDGYWCSPDSEEWPGFFAQNPYRVYAEKFGPALARERSAKAEEVPQRYKLHLLDLFLPAARVEPSLAHEPQNVEVFPDGGFAALHTDLYSEKDIAVLARASRFCADSHRHADQGSFALFAGGTALISPSGYFGAAYGTKHHSEWTRTTAAHNTLLIDGAGQPLQDVQAVGAITAWSVEDRSCTLDLSRAYPNTPLVQWERTLSLHEHTLTVCDTVQTETETELSFLLHTLSRPEAQGNAFTLCRNGVRLTVTPQEGLATAPCISDRFGVALNEGVASEFAVTMPPQYHVTYKTDKAKTHRIVVTFDVAFEEA